MAVVLAIALHLPHSLRAQVANAGISGTVRDSLGAPMERVVVEARNGETGYLERATTNQSGHYALLGLPLGGPYTLRTRLLGYHMAERAGIVLTIGARPTANFGEHGLDRS